MDAPARDGAIIEIREVHKTFLGVPAVSGISLELHPGEILGLVGPNGAGKTTIIRMLLAMLRPDRGEVRCFGAPAGPAIKSRIAYLPEERGLYAGERVLEVLVYLGSLKGLPRREARARAERLLARHRLAQVAQRRVADLSKGMQQRIQFIATVMSDATVLVFDEPFSGLDPVSVRDVSDLIRHERDLGKGIVLSTHLMTQVEALCDRMLMLHRGQAVEYGRVSEILTRETTRAYRLVAHGASQEALCALPGVERVDRDLATPNIITLHLDAQADARAVLASAVRAGLPVESYAPRAVTIEDIFVKHVGREALSGSDERNP